MVFDLSFFDAVRCLKISVYCLCIISTIICKIDSFTKEAECQKRIVFVAGECNHQFFFFLFFIFTLSIMEEEAIRQLEDLVYIKTYQFRILLTLYTKGVTRVQAKKALAVRPFIYVYMFQ